MSRPQAAYGALIRTHARSRRTVERYSRIGHMPGGPADRKVVAQRAKWKREGLGHGNCGRCRDCGGAYVAPVVSDQQEALDEFLRDFHCGAGAGMPGSLLLD